jgi:hypothetical protein
MMGGRKESPVSITSSSESLPEAPARPLFTPCAPEGGTLWKEAQEDVRDLFGFATREMVISYCVARTAGDETIKSLREEISELRSVLASGLSAAEPHN